jgi:hypothetical protein
MAQSPPFKPGLGFPTDSQTNLLRKLVWNTWVIAGSLPSGGGSIPSVVPVPASSASPGVANQMAWDGNYAYFYSVGHGWRRTAIDDWA